MRKKRIFKSAVIFCLALMWSLPVYAEKTESTNDPSSMIHGHINVRYVYTGMIIDQVKTHISKLNLDFDDLVAQSVITVENGVAAINTQLPDITVVFDDQSFPVVNNEFMIDGMSPGEHNIKIYSNDTQLLENEISILPGHNSIPIDVDLDMKELVTNLENKMQPQENKIQSLNDSLFSPQTDFIVTPMSDPDYWNGYYVGQLIGQGSGVMLLLTNQGHVSCNKSYWDHGANFPYNDSDCALAVSSGALYYSNPVLFSAYSQGAYCVQEAMDSKWNPSRSNVYCNQTAKPNAAFTRNYLNKGYNCSSFMFLGGDERLNHY